MDVSHDIKKGKICSNCTSDMGITSFAWMKSCNADEIVALAKIDKDIDGSINYEVPSVAKFDDANHVAYFLPRLDYNAPAHEYVKFSYDQIQGCEIIENGGSTTSNAFEAAVGTAILGTAGAVIGGAGGRDAVCNSLSLKLTVNNYEQPAFYIDVLTTPISTTTAEYYEALRKAHDIVSKINMLKKEKTVTPDNVVGHIDPVVEIRRYKELADEGIITFEEFEAKKKQLLGL
jgi:hypothetical protein